VSTKRTPKRLRTKSKRETDRSSVKQVAERVAGKKSTARRKAPAKPLREHADRNYVIGKGKPPPEHTWRPGQSGNSRGRPKGRKNESTIWKEILGRKITIPIGGKLRKVTILEAIQYRIANDALTGNIKSAGFILNRFAITVTGDDPVTDSSEDDRAVLEAFVRRLKDETSET
jgi:hypothetical protein